MILYYQILLGHLIDVKLLAFAFENPAKNITATILGLDFLSSRCFISRLVLRLEELRQQFA
jgi:hypothetical protein